jgi:hypothetical protein
MRRLLDTAGAAVLATLVFVALLVLRPFGLELLVHLYLLVLAGVVLAGAAAAVRASTPARRESSFDAALRRGPPPQQRPAQLARVERFVTIGQANAYDFHARLRPLLREAADARLARTRGIALDSPAGRAAVGEDAWALLRPDREPPDDRHVRGLGAERLRELVEMLETL